MIVSAISIVRVVSGVSRIRYIAPKELHTLLAQTTLVGSRVADPVK